MKIVTGIIGVFITLPIWFYLVYSIMVKVEATELMWFLFWVYVPFSVIVASLKVTIDGQGDKK